MSTMNLGEVWIDTDGDAASVWAAQHEFTLRQKRYLFFLGGGLVGAIKRATSRLHEFDRVLRGIDAEASDTAVVLRNYTRAMEEEVDGGQEAVVHH